MEASLLALSPSTPSDFHLAMETDNKVREMFAPAQASQLRQETDKKVRD